MAALTGLTTIKRFLYRGDSNEEFSNTYWFTGSVPADSAAWRALFDALVNQEKLVLQPGVSVIGGYAYDDNADGATSVWSVDLRVPPNSPVAGTYDRGTGISGAGDQAAWVRWGLDKLNSKGKRVYLRKYFHDCGIEAGGGDSLLATYIAALNGLGAKLQDGSFLDGRTICDRKDPGVDVLNHGASTYVTTRTLKRRGKRP